MKILGVKPLRLQGGVALSVYGRFYVWPEYGLFSWKQIDDEGDELRCGQEDTEALALDECQKWHNYELLQWLEVDEELAKRMKKCREIEELQGMHHSE